MNKPAINFRERKKKPDLSPLLYGKMPPQATDLESAVLGALMLESRKMDDVTAIIPEAECFYTDANQRIFEAIKRMYNRGARIDFMTVCEELKTTSELEIVGGSYYVTSLTMNVVSSANIEEHSRIVMQKYIMREIIRKSGELLNEAYEDTTDVFDLLQRAETEFTKLSEENIKTPYQHISYNAIEDINDIQLHRERIEQNGSMLTGVSSGFQTVDRITNGWQKGDLIILAARPSVGKTAFALNLAINAGVPVGFFSLEMTMASLRKRINSMQTSVGLTNITSCRLDDAEFIKLRDNVGRLNKLPLYVDDSDTLTVFEMKTKARRMKKKHGIGLIIIDYLQLTTSTSGWNREQQIAEISRELKKLAKELEIPVIALSQMSRDVEKRKGEPMLSDLRESGAIEQDADLVTFLYWHDDNIRWKVAKHRNGKLDRVDFIPNLDIQKFAEIGSEFPEAIVQGYKPTEYSGNLIPIAQARKRYEEEEQLPFVNNASTPSEEADELPF